MANRVKGHKCERLEREAEGKMVTILPANDCCGRQLQYGADPASMCIERGATALVLANMQVIWLAIQTELNHGVFGMDGSCGLPVILWIAVA